MKKQALLIVFLSITGFTFLTHAMQRPLIQLSQAELDALKEARIHRLNHLSELLKVNSDCPAMAAYVEREANLVAQQPDVQLSMNILKRARSIERSAREALRIQQGILPDISPVGLPQSP